MAAIFLLNGTRHWRGGLRGSILPSMSVQEQPQHEDGRTIRVGGGPDGSITYLVDLPPEALPTVYKRDLELAWYAARDAAIADHWGSVRAFRFNRPDGSHVDLALADRDASCWVSAVDRSVGWQRRGACRCACACLRSSTSSPAPPGLGRCSAWPAMAPSSIRHCCAPPPASR